MPTYVYRREDGTKFEIKQRITDDPLEECPETGQPVERVIAGSAGLIFKGDGFYITDYGKGDTGRKVDTASNTSSGDASSEETPDSTTSSDNSTAQTDASTDSKAA